MRRILILFIMLSGLREYAIGQSSLGMKAGFNLANQRKAVSIPQNLGTQTQKTKLLPGYQVGLFGKTSLDKALSLTAEVNFSVIGSKTYYVTEQQILNPDGNDHYYHDKLGYIEVPVMLQYNLNKLYFGVGPSVGIKVFSKITNFEGNATYPTPFYKTVDAAANLLAGYKLLKKLDLNLRYSYGLLNIHEENQYLKVRNRFLNLSVLYSIK